MEGEEVTTDEDEQKRAKMRREAEELEATVADFYADYDHLMDKEEEYHIRDIIAGLGAFAPKKK